MYEDEYMRGGIPNFSYARPCMSYGKNLMENLQAMMKKYPLMNDYWKDKAADFEKIRVPAYVVASYSSELHTEAASRVSGAWSRRKSGAYPQYPGVAGSL